MKKTNKKYMKTVSLATREELTIEELVFRIQDIIDHDDVAYFIALLEKSYESWDVTEALMNHYSSLKEVYLKEFDEEEQNLVPKNILE